MCDIGAADSNCDNSETKRVWLILLLGSLAALPSLSIDIGIAGFSVMRQEFETSIASTGLIITMFMFGLAVGQLGFGLLSDRIGRRPVLLLGTTIYVLAGMECAITEAFETLLSARLLQGIGAGAGTVLSLTIIRDLFDGAAARMMRSYVVAIVSVVPLFAPALGSWMLEFWNWRMAYAVPAAYGTILTIVAAICFSETRPMHLDNAQNRLSKHYSVLLSRSFIGHVLTNALSYAALMSYIAGSAFVFMNTMGLSAQVYAFLFAATATSVIIGAWVNGRLTRGGILGTNLLAASLVLAMISGIVLMLVPANSPAAWIFFPILMVNVSCRGMVGPQAQHAALEPLPQIAGTSAAILSFVQIIAGAVASLVVAVLYQELGPAGVTGAIAGCSIASFVVWLWAIAPCSLRTASST